MTWLCLVSLHFMCNILSSRPVRRKILSPCPYSQAKPTDYLAGGGGSNPIDYWPLLHAVKEASVARSVSLALSWGSEGGSRNYMGAEELRGLEWANAENIDICPYVAPPPPTLAFSIDREKGKSRRRTLLNPYHRSCGLNLETGDVMFEIWGHTGSGRPDRMSQRKRRETKQQLI